MLQKIEVAKGILVKFADNLFVKDMMLKVEPVKQEEVLAAAGHSEQQMN